MGVRKNVATPPDYDQMATAAAGMGLVNTSVMRRWEVAAGIAKRMEDKGIKLKDLPQVCPTQKNTDRLYNASLEQEVHLFPERDPHWETKAQFDEMMEGKKLCSV